MISILAMPDTKGDANQDSASREDAIDRPLEYLFTSSGASIESFHLSRLNAVANLRKELHEIFEAWVEAEVQARLAQWLLARKNSETRADASSITIDSGENRNAPTVGTRPGARPATRSIARSTTRATVRRAAAANSVADSTARSCLARLNSTGSDNSNNSSINSGNRVHAVRAKNRAARAVSATLTTRPLITNSTIVGRTQRFPLFVHPNVAIGSANISKSGRATPTLLSFRRPNHNSIAS